MPVSPEQIAALIEGPYRDHVPVWRELPADPVRRVTHLRKSFPADAVPAILELSELRDRAREKFARAGEMFFDREALEQATAEEIARERALMFCGDAGSIADLTCGNGGDTLQLAGCSSPTFACDISAVRVRIARANFESLLPELLPDVTFRTAPAEDYPEADAYFIDPSRRVTESRSRHLAGMSPSVELILELARKAGTVAVKLSPATPDEELALLGGSVEFVSHRGECKEAVVWFGRAAPHVSRRARIVGGCVLDHDPGAPDPPVSQPLRYLLEPDPAVVRAGIIPDLCRKLGCAVMDPHVAYLTADAPGQAPLVTSYAILASLPFSAKALRAELRNLGIGRVEVKKRASAVDVDALRKQLSTDAPGRGVVAVTRIGRKPWAFICSAQ